MLKLWVLVLSSVCPIITSFHLDGPSPIDPLGLQVEAASLPWLSKVS